MSPFARQAAVERESKSALMHFYRKQAPNKADGIDKLLLQFKGAANPNPKIGTHCICEF